MDVVALIVWIVTALGGFALVGFWLAGGAARQLQARGRSAAAPVGQAASGPTAEAPTAFPLPVLVGHVLLAAAGLIVWIIYLVADSDSLKWPAFGVLVAVALLGFTLFLPWLRRRRAASEPRRSEDRLPLPVVLLHGALGAATLVLVVLVAASVVGS